MDSLSGDSPTPRKQRVTQHRSLEAMAGVADVEPRALLSMSRDFPFRMLYLLVICLLVTSLNEFPATTKELP